MQDALWEKMLDLANTRDLPSDHPMRTEAAKLRQAVENDAGPQTIIGAWARARRIYCEFTGEPLI